MQYCSYPETYEFLVTTTNGTGTDISGEAFYALTDANGTYTTTGQRIATIRMKALLRTSGAGTDGAYIEKIATFRSTAPSSIAQIGSATSLVSHKDASLSTTDITLTATDSGDYVEVVPTVTGVAATTIIWYVIIEVMVMESS